MHAKVLLPRADAKAKGRQTEAKGKAKAKATAKTKAKARAKADAKATAKAKAKTKAQRNLVAMEDSNCSAPHLDNVDASCLHTARAGWQWHAMAIFQDVGGRTTSPYLIC